MGPLIEHNLSEFALKCLCSPPAKKVLPYNYLCWFVFHAVFIYAKHKRVLLWTSFNLMLEMPMSIHLNLGLIDISFSPETPVEVEVTYNSKMCTEEL